MKNSAGPIIAYTFFFSMAYAILRYHIAGPVPWDDLPFFIFNKGISLTAFILLTFNFTLGPLKNLGVGVGEGWLNARKAMGMTGFLLVLIHALMSFLIFKPEIFGRFFTPEGGLTLFAGISMLGGILGFVVLWAMNLSFQTYLREDKAFIAFITSRKFMLVALLFGMIHVFFMGIDGWMNPSGWYGGLPPISLVAFAFCTVGYVINLAGRA
jgi:DMSO/TMAO reductase YedYZ heme-binding membrane subunit